jgi:Flp pilus assembly protein TadG
MKKLFKKMLEEKGQAVVEFAIVLPILLAILGGIIDFGWIYSNQLAINNCTREAARYAAVNSDQTNYQELITAKINAIAAEAIKENLQISVAFSDTLNPTNGDVVVTVQSSVNALTPLVGIFFENQQVNLLSSVTMKVE